MASKKGFTLIELLVVIAIVSLLSSVVMSAVNTSRAKSRDAQRVSQIREIQKAIEAYTADHGQPPTCTLSKNDNRYWCGSCDTTQSITLFNQALQPLVDGGYLKKIPSDPKGGNCMNYEYYTLPDNPTPLGNAWACSGQSILNYSYTIRFSTERNQYSGFYNFMWNRTNGGQEYCVLGQKIR